MSPEEIGERIGDNLVAIVERELPRVFEGWIEEAMGLKTGSIDSEGMVKPEPEDEGGVLGLSEQLRGMKRDLAQIVLSARSPSPSRPEPDASAEPEEDPEVLEAVAPFRKLGPDAYARALGHARDLKHFRTSTTEGKRQRISLREGVEALMESPQLCDRWPRRRA